jgi:hypothetical protein
MDDRDLVAAIMKWAEQIQEEVGLSGTEVEEKLRDLCADAIEELGL